MGREAKIILEYQNYIETPPVPPANLYQAACSNDTVTINHWRNTWINNVKSNHAKYGPFKDKSIAALHKSWKGKPAIVAGSGPSLKVNAEELKNRGKDCVLVSCLHNFHYMEEIGAEVDYYVTLDAGDVTIEEVYEGGSKSQDEYWALTEKRTLLAFIGTSPRLLEKWRGKVLFYNCPVADQIFIDEVSKLEKFNVFVSTGGNVLGASAYVAKGFLGASILAFVGADFSFSYEKKFHSWDSKYDANLGLVAKAVDVFGNKVVSWTSYLNFKSWFEWLTLNVLGVYINCTEGGCFGSYADGNLMSIRQMELKHFIKMINMSDLLDPQCSPEGTDERLILF